MTPKNMNLAFPSSLVSSSRKDNNINTSNKKEFEEVFKKSTEKLIYEIPNKNKDAVNKDKFSLWKSNSGRQEATKMSKPPKYINPSAGASGPIKKQPTNTDKSNYINASKPKNQKISTSK
jgi:hypothetical protein